jgi:hypothetical protein
MAEEMTLQITSHQQNQYGPQNHRKKEKEKATNYHLPEDISLGVTEGRLCC